MNVVTDLLQQAEVQSQNLDETVRLLCQAAEKLDQLGKYEEAAQVLSLFWAGLGHLPRIDGLGLEAKAYLLWRVGVLSDWLGSITEQENPLAGAKDLISEGQTLFREIGDAERVLASQVDLAHCYWREGSFDESRILLKNNLQEMDSLLEVSAKTKARTLLLLAIVEQSATRYKDALTYLSDATPLVETLDDHAFRGRFHNQMAIVYKRLGDEEKRNDYIDRALLEYEAASFSLEQAGSLRNWAIVEINLGSLFTQIERWADAHKHLNRARQLFQQMGDKIFPAQIDETRARAFLGQKRFADAEKVIQDSCSTFETVGDNALLAEALTTYGVILARQGKRGPARAQFAKAAERGELYGSVELAGLALLGLIEELGAGLSAGELQQAYLDADRLLTKTQSPDALARLRVAARGLLEAAPMAAEHTPQLPAEKITGANAAAPSLENLITEVANRYRKPLTFTHEALATARRYFLKDNLQTWQKLLEHTAEIASSKDTITEQAVRIVALRQTADANFLHPWENFVLRDWTHAAEHEFIEIALREADGKISVAANLLGFDHYESLNSMIKSRHKDLLEVRTKPIPRRRSIIKVKKK